MRNFSIDVVGIAQPATYGDMSDMGDQKRWIAVRGSSSGALDVGATSIYCLPTFVSCSKKWSACTHHVELRVPLGRS